jgi:hypothetical protein
MKIKYKHKIHIFTMRYRCVFFNFFGFIEVLGLKTINRIYEKSKF